MLSLSCVQFLASFPAGTAEEFVAEDAKKDVKKRRYRVPLSYLFDINQSCKFLHTLGPLCLSLPSLLYTPANAYTTYHHTFYSVPQRSAEAKPVDHLSTEGMLIADDTSSCFWGKGYDYQSDKNPGFLEPCPVIHIFSHTYFNLPSPPSSPF